MSGPSGEKLRLPAVAGRFYPADPVQCRAEAEGFLGEARPAREHSWIGGIVPHAGWICSGAVAGQTIAPLASQGPVDVVVVFGAIHSLIQTASAALDSHQRWALPVGEVALNEELQRRLPEQGNLFAVDERLHAGEHAVEVNVPLLQVAWPGAAIVPIEVPVVNDAALMGRKAAQCVAAAGLRAVFLASSDLTHYGPAYRFVPAGIGPEALDWAKRNDRRLLDLVESLSAERIVPEAQEHQNACGAGAIAAMLGACRELGATRARVLRHVNSCETLAGRAPQPSTNAVGYASVVVG